MHVHLKLEGLLLSKKVFQIMNQNFLYVQFVILLYKKFKSQNLHWLMVYGLVSHQ
jgi:hypothetical protein